MANPLFSIITVVYNGCKTIEQTIQSVLCQTYNDYEYIIIDGGSTDGTVDIIRKYEGRLSYWISEPDQGIYDAMNKGISMSKGTYIGIINSDDWYENFALENIAAQIGKHNGSMDMFYGLIRYYDINMRHIKTAGNTLDYLQTEMIAHPSCFIKKAVYEELGMFDLQYKSASDYDFMLRFFNGNRSAFFSEMVLANFRIGGMSGTKKGAMEALKLLYNHGHMPYVKYLAKKINTTIYFALQGCYKIIR